jgi:hypothetical protein
MPQPYPDGDLVIDCSDLDRSADRDGNEFCVLQPPGIPSA